MGEGKSIYQQAMDFKLKYPLTVTWFRLKKHAKIIEKHLNPDEKVLYVFAAQKNNNPLDIVTTCIVTLTNKRLLVAQKRVLFGYFLASITPELFNDLSVRMGLIWGTIIVDTVKETVYLSNIDKNALPEIETKITTYMMKKKRSKKESENIESS